MTVVPDKNGKLLGNKTKFCPVKGIRSLVLSGVKTGQDRPARAGQTVRPQLMAVLHFSGGPAAGKRPRF
jgi:hypothetical protein